MCTKTYYPRWSPYYKYSWYSKWSPYSKYRWYSDWSPYYKYRGRWYSTSSPYYKYGWYLSPYYRYGWYSRLWPYNKYRWYSSTWPYYNYNWYPRWPYYKSYFDDNYYDLKYKMNMFKSDLKAVPKNRSDFVNDLEIPDDWRRVYDDVEELLTTRRRDSLLSASADECDVRPASGLSTDSSISLSRAMTDSEIDYDRYRRLRNRSQSDPFNDMKIALETFPSEYLTSLRDFQEPTVAATTTYKPERPLYNESLHRRMEKYFDEECRVFDPDDPSLLELEEALNSLDMKALQADLDKI